MTTITNPAIGFLGVTTYSITGYGNNPSDPTAGAAGTDETRFASPNFVSGSPANIPVSGPDPRVISNTIFAGDTNANDPAGRSAYDYAFGQFVDHDIDLNNDQPTAADGSNVLSMTVPPGDPSLVPGSEISITRGQVDPSNGNAINAVTQYLDLSQVYGSDPTTAAGLRNADGTLKTSAGDNLPIVDGSFATGDSRDSENPDIAAINMLFVREHNYWVGQLQAEDPSLTGDQLYNDARAIVTAEYQNIVYTEFLPSILGPDALTQYAGFDPSVSPDIAEEFSTAAYRFGHSIISPTETKIAEDGTVLKQNDLAAEFGTPINDFNANGGADALLRNLAQDFSQQEGATINSDLRNLLNDANDTGDLAAIDILRERDMGVATLNQTRTALGLAPYTSFNQITSDSTVAAELQQVYGSVDNVDLFVGGLAEDPMPGAMVGQTFEDIITQQFENLRDGDPNFYLNQGFSPQLLQQIQDTTLSDLIVRDGDTQVMQANAFVATERHASDVPSPNPTAPQLVIGIDTPNATIQGSPGVDNTIVAGDGLNQILTGGGSSDQFMFIGGGHVDTITDFQPGADTLDFENDQPNSSVAISGGNGVTQIATGGDVITVQGANPTDFTAANVLFNQQNPQLQATQHVTFMGSGNDMGVDCPQASIMTQSQHM